MGVKYLTVINRQNGKDIIQTKSPAQFSEEQLQVVDRLLNGVHGYEVAQICLRMEDDVFEAAKRREQKKAATVVADSVESYLEILTSQGMTLEEAKQQTVTQLKELLSRQDVLPTPTCKHNDDPRACPMCSL